MAACGGRGGCQSNCARSQEDDAEVQTQTQQESLANLSINGGGERKVCSKCGEAEQDYNGMCAACFRLFLFGKFKLAVTCNAMIAPTYNVLVAFSGGPASRVCSLKPCHEIDQAIEEIRSIVSDLGPPHKKLHITPIESIYSLERMEGRNRLKELLLTITDVTGKEDFLQHLRVCSLQKIALDNKYNKLVLGSCSSGIARHIISSTVKGKGYSLPADLQYVDVRWEVPVVLPLRDCLSQELRMLCHLDSLETQLLLDRPYSGINGLVSSFVARLQDENPSRERTIVRTAEKLKPFYFNKLVENGYLDFLPSRLRSKFQDVNNSEPNPSEDLCPICGSPLSLSDLQSMKSPCGKPVTRTEIFVANCCQSCCFQILPKETVSLEHFYSLLPRLMTDRVKDTVYDDHSCLREQIKD